MTTPDDPPPSEPKPEAKSEPEPEAKSEPEPEAKSEPEPEAKSEPEPKSEPAPKSEPEPEAKPEPESGPKSEPGPEPESEAPTTDRNAVTVDTLAPERGPLVGGTRVKVVGSGFVEGCTIEVDGTSVPAELISPTELAFVTPPRVNAGKAPVLVVVGEQKSEPAFFEFARPEPPTIVSIAPATGPLAGGTELVIAGLHFVDGAVVRVGDIAATVRFEAAIQLRAVTPPRITAGKVDVRVELPDGQSAVAKEAFEYERARAPKIERITPTRGPAIGGTALTIEGASFAPGCVVDVGGQKVTPTLEGARLSVVTPKSALGGMVYVSVVNPDGQVDVVSDGFEYDEPRDPPHIEDVWPRRGLPETPARITIEGKGFALPCRVEVGGVVCDVQQLTAREIVATVPGRAAIGAVDVVVTNPDGQAHTLKGGFAWLPPDIEPTVASVLPASGPLLGGTTIVLHGAGFDDKTYVQILDQVVIGKLFGDGRLSVVTPRAARVGPVDIRVMNSEGGSCTVEGGFTYELLELPVVTGVAPVKGPVTGGTKVIIEGTGFQKETAILIDRGTKPQNVVVESATRIVVTMPPGERPGAVDLRILCPDGQSITRTKAFLYEAIPPPVLERWDPKYGSAAGGWKLTVEGKNFAPGCFVIVGGTAAKTRRIDDKNLEATVAAFEASAYADVSVRNPDGQTATSKNAIQVSRR